MNLYSSDEPVATSTENESQLYDKTNLFRVYPNPAKDLLHVQMNEGIVSFINESGKILLTKTHQS